MRHMLGIIQVKWIDYIISFISLLVGSFIYLIFRPMSLLMFKWVDHFGLTEKILSIRVLFNDFDPNNFVIYNLPNGLWVLSISILLIKIWGETKSKYFKIYMSFLFILVVLPETLQFFKLLDGTFDVFDLVVNLVFFSLPFYCKKLFSSTKK